MRIRSIGMIAVAVFALSPGQAQAQTLGPLAAYHGDLDFGLGAQFGMPLESFGDGVGLLADFIYFFPPGTGFDYFEFNGNVTYDFPLENSTVGPFVLAGLSVGRSSVDLGPFGSGSNTDVNLNVGGGIFFDAGTFRPLVAGRIVLGDGSSVVFWASLPFDLSN